MDQAIRNKLRGVVTQCRKALEDAVETALESPFGIYAEMKGGKKTDTVIIDADDRMTNLGDEERAARKDILDHFVHIKARGFKPKEALDQLVREVAFTHLNRLCAYKMMEARQVYVGDQRFREAVSRGVNSNGVKFYRADHPDDDRLFSAGKQDVAYRHFLDWLGGILSEEIGVLFSPHDPANRLYPPQKVLDEVLALINDEELADIWTQDETIGWVYQYFTKKELRDQARKESQAPRNSYELAFRNQFFTPRYVVEFLTDNTLGRVWYEMRKGNTKLKDRCKYMVRRPSEVFLADPLAAAKQLGIKVEVGKEIPPGVQAAFRGDFASAMAEKDGIVRSWIGMVVPHDQYEAATGHPLRENEDHPSITEVWSALSEHPDGNLPLHPLKIIIALSQLVRTSSGGPYAAGATDQLWAALAATVNAQAEQSDLSQDELLKLPVCVPHRAKKDPRELKILDPAAGSGHFLLYCFDLLLLIYEEAYTDPDLGQALQRDYPTWEALQRDVPRLILAHNLHGIDIDLRASQIAALALWLRCQRAYQDMGLKKDRPKITRSNFVCAEPMPGEQSMLEEFIGQLEPRLLGQLVKVVFDKMKLAGEAGSLLKIEEEISHSVAEAERQFRMGGIKVQQLLFEKTPVSVQMRFDVSGLGTGDFFEHAEAKVVDALRSYAEKAHNGHRLQRRLFTEDAVRGFAFVDICHKRFDVILMNPPFGEPTGATRTLFKDLYPTAADNLAVSFMLRSRQMCGSLGRVGSITDCSWSKKYDYTDFRKTLVDTRDLALLIDLGWSVMDTANVEANLAVRAQGTDYILAANLSDSNTKEVDLLRIATMPSEMRACTFTTIGWLPNYVFAYDMPHTEVASYRKAERLSDAMMKAVAGVKSCKSEADFRTWWEVPERSLGEGYTWEILQNGSPYSPYHYPACFAVRSDSGTWGQLMRFGGARPGESHYRQMGLAYGKRTDDMYAYVMPRGQIFSQEGQAIFPVSPSLLWPALQIANSTVYARHANYVAGQHKYHNYLNLVCLPTQSIRSLGSTASQLHGELSALDACNETSLSFIGITALPELDLGRPHDDRHAIAANRQSAFDMLRLKADREVSNALGIDSECPVRPVNYYSVYFDTEYSDRLVVAATVSYLTGCAFGRWKLTSVPSQQTDGHVKADDLCQGGLPPAHAATLVLGDATASVSVEDTSILVDDPEHPHDIVRAVEGVIDLIWKDRTEAIEKQSCEILGVRLLRDYFRKPGKGGFWCEHVSRYSKSRRKAPIYWLLQSEKANYALWLYGPSQKFCNLVLTRDAQQSFSSGHGRC